MLITSDSVLLSASHALTGLILTTVWGGRGVSLFGFPDKETDGTETRKEIAQSVVESGFIPGHLASESEQFHNCKAL